MRYFLLIFLGLVSFSGLALADCSNPTGSAGRQMYNTTFNVMQFCDGTLWQSMKGGGTLAGLNCGDGELVEWNNGGGVWECASAGGGGITSVTVVESCGTTPSAVISATCPVGRFRTGCSATVYNSGYYYGSADKPDGASSCKGNVDANGFSTCIYAYCAQ